MFYTCQKENMWPNTSLNAELNNVLTWQTAEHTAVVFYRSTDARHSLPVLQNILSPWDNSDALLMSTRIGIDDNR